MTASIHKSHTHEFEYYLLSDEEGSYLGNVSQLPPVIVQGKSESEIAEKITKSTQEYLHFFPNEHARVLKDTSSKLKDKDFTYTSILGKKPFTVEC